MTNRASNFLKFFLFTWLFLSFSVTVRAQELKKIKIGYPAVSYNQIHIWVAKDAGFFRKYGLDAELIFFRGGQLATQALVAGDPPIVNIGTLVQDGLQGHDVVLIASSESSYAYSVVTLPSITKVEQLKGKKFGVSGFGSASHNAALIFFKKFNLEPNKEVGGPGGRAATPPRPIDRHERRLHRCHAAYADGGGLGEKTRLWRDLRSARHGHRNPG